MVSSLSSLDVVVFVLVMITTYGMVIAGRSLLNTSKSSSPLNVILAGRCLTLPLFIATIVATWYGGVLGVTQISYESGIFNFVTQGVFWYLSYLIFAVWVVPRIRASQALTLPHLVRMKFGPKAELITSLFNISNVLPTAYILAIGLLIHTLFQTSVVIGSIMGVVVVVSYSLLGGVRSIILSDLVQCVVMIIAVYAVFIVSQQTFGGVSFLKNHLPPSHFEITGGHSITTLVMWGLIAMSTLADPNFYHRIFAAASDQVARRGLLISTVIWMLIDLATTAGGMYAAAAIQGGYVEIDPHIDSTTAYLAYALEILPNGLRGLFIAGIAASILSTIDSYLFLASSTISYDLQKKTNHFLQSYWKNLIICASISAVLAVIFSQGWSGAHGIRDIWKTFGSFSAGCILLPVMMGVFSSHPYSDRTFVTSTICSLAGMIGWKIFTSLAPSQLSWMSDIHEIYFGIGCCAVVFGLAKLKDYHTSS